MYYSPDLSKSERDHLIGKNEEYIKEYKNGFCSFLLLFIYLNQFACLFEAGSHISLLPYLSSTGRYYRKEVFLSELPGV